MLMLSRSEDAKEFSNLSLLVEKRKSEHTIQENVGPCKLSLHHLF